MTRRFSEAERADIWGALERGESMRAIARNMGRAHASIRQWVLASVFPPELETAVRVRINFVVLIFEDSSYGVIKWKQLKRYGRAAFVDFRNPDFAALAESFGCRGYRVNAAQELRPMLEAHSASLSRLS